MVWPLGALTITFTLALGICAAVLCNTVLCDTVLCDTVLCDTVLCDTVLCDTVLCDTVLWFPNATAFFHPCIARGVARIGGLLRSCKEFILAELFLLPDVDSFVARRSRMDAAVRAEDTLLVLAGVVTAFNQFIARGVVRVGRLLLSCK